MIRTALFPGMAGCLLLAFACGNDPKPQPLTPAEQQNPELAHLNRLLAEDPTNDSLLHLRAEAYYNVEAYDEALRDLSAAIQQDSLQPRYYHLLADVLLDYSRPNDSKRALDVLLTAAYLFPDRIQTLLKLSELQLIVKQHGDALVTLDKILKTNPQHPEAFYMAGRVALDKGDTLSAIASFRKSLQINADNVDGWRILGRIFINRNDPLAIQYLDNALRVDSTDVEAREYKAMFYKFRGEFDKAFEIYRSIIVQNPDYSNAYFDMGAIYLELDSLQKAYEHFDFAVKTDPLFVLAYHYRGVASELMGDVDGAKKDYLRANKMSPNHPDPKAALERLGVK
ncbi:MAG: tetratricopeptide repeat protein [Saprospiraceae bacterium]